MGEFAESIRPLRRVEYDRMVEMVPEDWVVDTTHGLVEVRTAIEQGVYSQVARYRPGQEIVLGAFPDVTIAVADILG